MAAQRTAKQKAASKANLEKARTARQSAYRANATGEMPPKDYTIRGSLRLTKKQRAQQVRSGAQSPKITSGDINDAMRLMNVRVDMGMHEGNSSHTRQFKALARRYMAVRSHGVREALQGKRVR